MADLYGPLWTVRPYGLALIVTQASTGLIQKSGSGKFDKDLVASSGDEGSRRDRRGKETIFRWRRKRCVL